MLCCVFSFIVVCRVDRVVVTAGNGGSIDGRPPALTLLARLVGDGPQLFATTRTATGGASPSPTALHSFTVAPTATASGPHLSSSLEALGFAAASSSSAAAAAAGGSSSGSGSNSAEWGVAQKLATVLKPLMGAFAVGDSHSRRAWAVQEKTKTEPEPEWSGEWRAEGACLRVVWHAE